MRSVLVVDDESTIAEVVEAALSTRGFAVRVAHDGRQALEQLATHVPDLVLSDVMMPYVDGVELARRMHETPALSGVPVILMSASGKPPGRADHTYAAFLAKPFDLGALITTVERIIGIESGHAAVEWP